MMNKLLKNAFANKKFKYIIIIGIVGFALVLMSNFNTNKTENNVVDDYAEKTEEKIGHIVCRITGEKSVAVMVSLESNGEIVYADAKNVTKNNKTDSQSSGEYRSEQSDDSEQKYIIVENSQGGEEALVVTKIAPVVKGVVVVTKYANSSAVSERIVSAVSTALNINEKRVCVVMGQ